MSDTVKVSQTPVKCYVEFDNVQSASDFLVDMARDQRRAMTGVSEPQFLGIIDSGYLED